MENETIEVINQSGDEKMLWEKYGKPAYERGLLEGRQESGLFAVIPMSILENKNLSANAKLLYGEIMALSKKSGKCYATNDYLGEVLGLKKESIPQLLKELSGTGLIMVSVDRNHKGTYRDITVSFFNEGGYGNLTRGGMANERGQKRNRQIEIDKKNIATASVAGNEVNKIIDLFRSINPTHERLFAQKPQRQATERLLKKLGREKLEQIIGSLSKSNSMDFSPQIFTPQELERKLGALIAFIQKQKTKSNLVITI